MFSITLIIIIITCLVSFAALQNGKIMQDLLFWPAEIESRKQYYRFLTHGLLHADFAHLFFNMYSLYALGTYVESRTFPNPDIFGDNAKIFYIVLYVSAIVISTLPDYFKNRDNSAYRALGASGAVSAVVFAGIILDPDLSLGILFIPIPIPGYIFGILFLGISVYLAKKGGSNIGHGAHFTGAVYGLIFAIIAAKLYANYDAMSIFVNNIFNRYQ
ncbi:MAG: rhomboid family intramembrane serine protease [Chitinophagaceae bacterium]